MNASKVLGIIGICTGWIVPIASIILGIIGLCMKKKSKVLNILSIVLGILFWVVWAALYGFWS